MVDDAEVPNADKPDSQETSKRVVDPSDAVTGLGFIFGLLGAVVGIGAAVFLSPTFGWSIIGYCLLAALAGGSAGVVTGGMIGAAIAVLRGVVLSAPGRNTILAAEQSKRTDRG